MDQETEAAAGFLRWRRRHALPPGTACYNCATKLQGPWCYRCGQAGEDFHRKAHHLIAEGLENLFHADGRLWHTLPALLIRPGHLTRSYLDGHRAPQIPPMRLFLIAVLLVFVAGSLGHGTGRGPMPLDPSDASGLATLHVHVYPAWDAALSEWLRTHIGRAITHPQALIAGMIEWAHRLSFLALPVSALILSLLFIRRRSVVLFDHLIFSMHSLSFLGLVTAIVLLAQAAGLRSANLLILAVPVHLFLHLRGTYGTGVAGTLARMSVLFVLSSLAFLLLLAAVVLASLAGLES